jgi:hypothetical protein
MVIRSRPDKLSLPARAKGANAEPSWFENQKGHHPFADNGPVQKTDRCDGYIIR